jgi:putative FmdB family regulatory protein
MPIYAYKCSSCGHTKDALQKFSDAPLSQCPACGESTFVKQLTAPGFQLKGSGWYVTDFRDGKKPAGDAKTDTAKSDAKPDSKAEPKPDTKTDAKTEAAATAPAASTPSATPAPTASTPAPVAAPPAK